MAPGTLAVPELGQLVEVRRRQYVVTGLRPSGLESGARQTILELASVEDDSAGELLTVVWEAELGASISETGGLPQPTKFDDPDQIDAFLSAVKWGAVSAADVRNLLAPFRSGIEIHDYQLEPLVRALQMPRVNLLVADGVGIGKTVEAGLVAQELILRNRVRSILVICPATLQIQWRDEMRDKFGLDFRIVDTELLKQLRRERGIHVNPWKHFPRLITSIDFIKRERPMQLFRELLPSDGHPTYPRSFDLMILDEAHGVAPSGAGKYATDSQRTLAIRELAPHFEHKLFLSATPHNGYQESFTSLLELLDPQRYVRGTRPNQDQLQTVTMVRRLKDDIPPLPDGTPRFPDRVLKRLEVDYTSEERQAHADLERFFALRTKSQENASGHFATEFMHKLLKKRLFSSPYAFFSTLEKHAHTLRHGKSTERASISADILKKRVEALTETYSEESTRQEAEDDVVVMSTRATAPLTSEQDTLLTNLVSQAERASRSADQKAKQLLEWLQSTLKPNGVWNDERVILFTEYRDTQNWLFQLLAQAGFAEDGRLETMFGGMDDDKREHLKAAFQADPSKSPVRILLATDTASEGINLQNHCNKLIHVEIPWNPNRMEQRNGRIDRHGQKRECQIYHFVGAGFEHAAQNGGLEADLYFLFKACEKVEQIREDLGKVGPVIEVQVERAMLGKSPRRLDTSEAERASAPIRKLLTAERKMREQIQMLRERLDETKRDLGISPGAVQSVVEVALNLEGRSTLESATVTGIERVFKMPPLTGAWESCRYGNPHPYTHEPRPIVFDHGAAEGRDDVELIHLNHRLVQMSLRLLRAEVWSSGNRRRLSRVSAKVVSDTYLSAPALIGFGRLVVLGASHQRLHEEVIISGGILRRDNVARMTQGDIATALKNAEHGAIPSRFLEELQSNWQTLGPSLMQALDIRMREVTRNLEGRFLEMAEREKREVRHALSELEATIRAEFKEPEVVQLNLFSDLERNQYDRNLDALRLRLEEIPGELEEEIRQVDRRYENPSPRFFPVCALLLVPDSALEAGGK
jgi:superfamily II DNA or RNA helicase